MQIVKQNNEIIEFLQRDRRVNLNALSYLAYNPDADVYIYGCAANGVIIGVEGRSFFFAAKYNRNLFDAFWESLSPGHKIFSGVPISVADMMLEGREPIWQSPCKVFFYNGEIQIADSSLKLEIGNLTAEDAEEVDEYYTYRSESSVRRLRESIEMMDSACIRIDGRLASWCLVHAEDGSLGPLYTKEEFRGKGLAEAVVTHLIKKLAAKNVTAYAQIVEDNAPSLALIKKLGCFDYSHDCLWFGLDKD